MWPDDVCQADTTHNQKEKEESKAKLAGDADGKDGPTADAKGWKDQQRTHGKQDLEEPGQVDKHQESGPNQSSSPSAAPE